MLGGANYRASTVYIAGINPGVLEKGRAAHGLVPVLIDESKPLGFGDGFFDIMLCSSAIEHVTVPWAEVWTISGGEGFRLPALARQADFANQIRKLGS